MSPGIPKTNSKLYHRLKRFFKKHQIPLLVIFFVIFFLVTFIISVVGGLRVFFPYLGQLTGIPFGQKNYLIVFQNNHELRPGGGFISSFATTQFIAGFPTKLQIEDVYGDIDEHQRLTAPYPMEKLLADQWYKGYSFRDGNYSPNFPDSARELIRLYQLSRPGEKIDGVIALNFSVLENLLSALGPVEVDGKWLSKDNLFEEITNQVNDTDLHNVQSLANRKSILKPLSNAIIKKILLNPFKLRKIADVISRSLTKKDLQLFFYNQGLQQLAVKNGWAGRWPTQVEGDFLAVNEANLGGMKSDRYINRHITYRVKFSEEYFQGVANPEANVTVDLNHFGIENIPLSGPYTGYFRVYNTPSEVHSAFQTTTPDPAQQGRTQPFSQIVKLQPGDTREFTETYQLPVGVIKDKIYNLYIPKQAGTHEDLYTIIIELPRGYRNESISFDTRENFAFWQGPLTKDLQLSLKVVEDTTPPRLILQENTELNKISLHFNEDLNQDYAADPFSYQVTDLDIINSSQTDQLRLKKVITTSKDVDLYLYGETIQPEERYGVRLKNLRDIHGNVLSDRQITVVQRLK